MVPSRASTLPLPHGWPRRARSAVVHAISLATASLTSARGWASESWNPRVRLNEENLGLRGEIALLREELRVKDARMARIPAQRRPHYPPAERLAILELRAARGRRLHLSALVPASSDPAALWRDREVRQPRHHREMHQVVEG